MTAFNAGGTHACIHAKNQSIHQSSRRHLLLCGTAVTVTIEQKQQATKDWKKQEGTMSPQGTVTHEDLLSTLTKFQSLSDIRPRTKQGKRSTYSNVTANKDPLWPEGIRG